MNRHGLTVTLLVAAFALAACGRDDLSRSSAPLGSSVHIAQVSPPPRSHCALVIASLFESRSITLSRSILEP
jgi:hypothetical protein